MLAFLKIKKKFALFFSLKANNVTKILSVLFELSTVENGRRFFPHCSEVLDKFLEDDMPDVFFLDKGSEEEQRIKKTRFMELKDEVQKAFHKDMTENHHIGLSSSLSSSSSTRRDGPNHKVRKR